MAQADGAAGMEAAATASDDGSSADASFDAGGGGRDGESSTCPTPLETRLDPGTGEGYFAISMDGGTCAVGAGYLASAMLVVKVDNSGSYPSTLQIWVPVGAPWHMVGGLDGGLIPQGPGGPPAVFLSCVSPPSFQTFTLVDGAQDTVRVSVACGNGFDVQSVLFSAGSSAGDAATE